MVVMMMMMMVVVVDVVDVEEPMYFFSTFEIRYTPFFNFSLTIKKLR